MARLIPWIAVDYDHTLVDGDKPLPGAKEAMCKLKDLGYAIMIHSCNNKGWIEKVLNANEIMYDHIWDGKNKPVCHAYIDDRGIGFNGNWDDAIAELESLDMRRDRIKKIYGDASSEAS